MGHIVLERLERHDLPAVQALLDACREHCAVVLGQPACPASAYPLYASLPPQLPRADKHLLGISDPETRELMGLIDALAHYPDAATLTVRLFLVPPWYGETAVPQEARRVLETWAAERGMRRARIEVRVSSWSARDFWRMAGFVAEAEPVRHGRHLVVVFEKWLIPSLEGEEISSSLWTA
jgi:hypothetical protein